MTLPKPGQRKQPYRPKYAHRKANYPDDETLIRMLNFTNMEHVGNILGVSKMAISYYVRSRGIEQQLFLNHRRAYLKWKKQQKAELLDLMFFNRYGNDRRNTEYQRPPEDSNPDSKDSRGKSSETHSSEQEPETSVPKSSDSRPTRKQ